MRWLNRSAAANGFRDISLHFEHPSRARSAFLRVIVGSALTALGWDAIGSGVALAQAPLLTDVIRSTEGDLQGVVADGVNRFLGIPYAAPPVGERRWQPPRDVTPWAQTLQATRFGNTCAQSQRGVFAAPSNTEDCLYLNVFAPASKPAQPANRTESQTGD